MTKVGILVHCRHLETIAWEDLVFGIPGQDKLGDLSTLVRVLLSLEPSEELASIVIGCGPSYRDGLSEGEYTKQFLLDNFDRLREFARLQPLLASLTDEQLRRLRAIFEAIIVTHEIKNTVAEIEVAAGIFVEKQVEKVVQICAASHASRCIKEQAVARSHGMINKNQLWQTVTTEVCYSDTTPEDVCVIEPLHRRDQPMTFVRPGLSEVMVPYFFLPDDDKKEFVKIVESFMAAKRNLKNE
jgi:hypothetical protein